MCIKGFCSRLMLSCSVPSAWGRYKESHSHDAFLDEVSGCHYLLNTLYNAIHRLHKFGTPTSCHHCCFKLPTPKEHHGMNMESSKCYLYMWWWCTGCLPGSYIWEYNIKMGNPKSSHKTASRHMGQYMHKEKSMNLRVDRVEKGGLLHSELMSLSKCIICCIVLSCLPEFALWILQTVTASIKMAGSITWLARWITK